MSLDALLDRADVWRGGQAPLPRTRHIPSGFAALDALLPGGGWPAGALSEILGTRHGTGTMQLVLPALAHLSREKRWLAWVAPPHIPYAPALAQAGVDLDHVLVVHPRAARDHAWAVEQALRSGTCGAVLAWLEVGDGQVLRRLQLAAEAGGSWGLVFRSFRAARQPSPAALRLSVEPGKDGMAVHILKRRGGWATGPVHLRPRPETQEAVFDGALAAGVH